MNENASKIFHALTVGVTFVIIAPYYFPAFVAGMYSEKRVAQMQLYG